MSVRVSVYVHSKLRVHSKKKKVFEEHAPTN